MGDNDKWCHFYLCLRDAEAGGELRPLWQRQVLRALEPALQLLNLKARVDAARFADLFALAVDPGDQLSVLHYTICK